MKVIAMPDFERVLDNLRVDLAKNELERQRAIGFIEGKRFARKEMLFLFLIVTAISAYVVISQ